jgi:hypothetical protein
MIPLNIHNPIAFSLKSNSDRPLNTQHPIAYFPTKQRAPH